MFSNDVIQVPKQHQWKIRTHRQHHHQHQPMNIEVSRPDHWKVMMTQRQYDLMNIHLNLCHSRTQFH